MPDPVLPTAVDPLQAPAGGPASDVPFVDDVDDIELDKEWINKAKIIADRTKDDPFRQSSELSKVKADYLRIKYNKQIKISED